MVLQTWGDVIIMSLQQVWASVASFVPMLFGSLLVFFIGLIISMTLGQLVEQIVKGLNHDFSGEKIQKEVIKITLNWFKKWLK